MTMHAASVALMQKDQIISSFELASRHQSRHILSMIKLLLVEAEISFSQLDGIAFGCGPGSFTGVRLSASVAQGIAFSANLPVFPVSSMQALAQGLSVEVSADVLVVALNAFAGDIYLGVYAKTQHSIIQTIVSEQRCLPQQFSLDEIDTKNCVVAGDGWQAYAEELKNKLPVHVKLYDDHVIHAKDIAIIAKHDLEQGGGVAPKLALPTYLHREDMWKKINK
jgi:tRNA threonylcarbamoyladenosine biosynthesis protein TsaB